MRAKRVRNLKATPTLINDTPTFCARKLASMLAAARMELIAVVQVSYSLLAEFYRHDIKLKVTAGALVSCFVS